MSLPETAHGALAGATTANPFTRKVRKRISSIPDRPSELGRSDAHSLDGFSIARIYTTFQLKRDEYFPGDLSDGAFEILVDLFLFEWLNRRVGSTQSTGMRMANAAELPAGAMELVAEGLALVIPSDAEGEAPAAIFTLSRTGRARLNIFFEYMASYISAI